MLREGYHHACNYRRLSPEDLRQRYPHGYLSFDGYGDMICRDWPRLEQIFGPPDDLPLDASQPALSSREMIKDNSDAASQIVDFVDRINNQYHQTMQETPGFQRWSTYFNNNRSDRADYPLLQGLDNEVILRRYYNLTMGSNRNRPDFPY
ncbi:uncharacterized protein PGTG_07802 [Puccinia graminis f. sp. tritici CRL 75-36-700-3]|uniref:Uncharacterized protein n=1 Tax=Puccinia graminis f. sp. tritici (strain CRL 75-36-700-3 / race SCCL) TaxID=418459 RepID=E3KB10_PUCGT|nr:uncharacterized protein PGTG_07802 [Puccinia graminis f. sp. tritici CRL 75-36-700-3]EFP81553.1 hypothetical protein PGTG_07802 [Puccinia graminis f. sp. tritici CRL 75-36-700-3]